MLELLLYDRRECYRRQAEQEEKKHQGQENFYACGCAFELFPDDDSPERGDHGVAFAHGE